MNIIFILLNAFASYKLADSIVPIDINNYQFIYYVVSIINFIACMLLYKTFQPTSNDITN